MKKFTFIIAAIILCAALTVAATTVDLVAGQDLVVGTVTVGPGTDADTIQVTYTITEDDWMLVETHLAVVNECEDIPTTKKSNNPIPGHFEFSDPHGPVTTYTYDNIDVSGMSEPICIAAHSVVEKTEVIQEAPYYPCTVISSSQGLKKGGTAVDTARSDPLQGLQFETGRQPTNFFSLGFGGEIIVEACCPITNGEGNDVMIIEDTWGTYPEENAEVYASQDGVNWTYLGEADNLTRHVIGIHTISEFDLGNLEWASFIKIVDTSDPALHNNAADGYDLNAIEILQDCVETYDETAWGDGDQISRKGNWGMCFEYTLETAAPVSARVPD
jgi:hypothetical protein